MSESARSLIDLLIEMVLPGDEGGGRGRGGEAGVMMKTLGDGSSCLPTHFLLSSESSQGLSCALVSPNAPQMLLCSGLRIRTRTKGKSSEGFDAIRDNQGGDHEHQLELSLELWRCLLTGQRQAGYLHRVCPHHVLM